MDYNTIVTLIGSIGFPIVMCLILFNFVANEQKKLTEAVNQLNVTMSRIVDRLDSLEGHVQ